MNQNFEGKNNVDSMLGDIKNVDIGQVLPNPYFAGFDISDKALQSEVERIHSMGALWQPVLVVAASNNKYIVAMGEKLYRAAKVAKLATIPIAVLDYSPEEVEQAALLELLQIQEIGFFQEARCYHQLINIHKISIQDVSKNVQKSVSTIEDRVRLLSLPETIWEKIESSNIKMGHAQALLSLKDTTLHEAVLDKIIEKNYTVKQTEEFVAEVLLKGRVDTVEYKQPRIVIKDARIIMNTLKKSISDVQKNIGVEVEMQEEQIEDYLVLTLRVPNKKGK